MKIAKEFCLERKEFLIKSEKWERVCAYICKIAGESVKEKNRVKIRLKKI